MKKVIMSYENFENAFIEAVVTGYDMLCVYFLTEDEETWTGDQVEIAWHPDTAYLHDQIAFEADMFMEDEAVESVADWDMVFDGVLAEYHDALCDSAKIAYERYIKKVGEDYDA